MACPQRAGLKAGVIGAFAVSLYGLLLNPDVFRKLFHFTESQEYRANVFCGWLSPLNQATFPMHSFGYDYLPGIGMSMFIFAILIIAPITPAIFPAARFKNNMRTAIKRVYKSTSPNTIAAHI